MFRSVLAISGIAFAALLPSASAPAPDVKATIEKLDGASARFSNAVANAHYEHYLALIHDVDTANDGSIYVVRAKDGKSQVGIRTEGAQARTAEYKNGVLRDYNPGTNCYNTIRKPGIDSYLSLGFGASGKELDAAWTIDDQGAETINGTKTEKLSLTPKDASVKANLKNVTVWVDLDRDVTLKSIFYSPNGDRNTAVYSNVRLNTKIDTKPFEIKGSECH